MRLALFFSLLLATTALADVGPRPPPCNVPSTCVTCENPASGGSDCAAAALDAGLALSECSDRAGSVLFAYYCPKDTPAVRSCGCATTDVLALSALFVVLPRLRRRR